MDSSELDYCHNFIFNTLVPKLGYSSESLLQEYFSSYYWAPNYYEHLIEFFKKVYDDYYYKLNQSNITELKKKQIIYITS